jgi:hypothetical protein
MKKRLLALAFLCLLFLTGCGLNQDMWVYDDETWKMDQVLEYNPLLIKDIEFEDIGIQIPVGGMADRIIEGIFNQFVQVYQQNGIQANLQRTATATNITYAVTSSGQGMTLLANIGLGGDTNAMLSSLAATYHLNPSQVQELMQQLQVPQSRTVSLTPVDEKTWHLVIEQATPAVGLRFKLHAQAIINSNASTVSGGDAQWLDPVAIDVTFQPISTAPVPADTLKWLLVGGGVLLGLVMLFAIILLAIRAGRGRGGRSGSPRPDESAAERIRRIKEQQRRANARRMGRR